MSRKESQEGRTPGIRCRDNSIETLRDQGNISMRIRMEVRDNMRQELCVPLVRASGWVIHKRVAPLGKSASFTPDEGVPACLMIGYPVDCLFRREFGDVGVKAFSYSRMRCPATMGCWAGELLSPLPALSRRNLSSSKSASTGCAEVEVPLGIDLTG